MPLIIAGNERQQRKYLGRMTEEPIMCVSAAPRGPSSRPIFHPPKMGIFIFIGPFSAQTDPPPPPKATFCFPPLLWAVWGGKRVKMEVGRGVGGGGIPMGARWAQLTLKRCSRA